jgi:uncharacterized membrane protein
MYLRGSTWLSFLVWNLFLAWLPLVVVTLLAGYLRSKSWRSRTALFLTAVWLIFLPNSFYIISDLVHVGAAVQTSLLFDAVLLFSFSFTGLMLGVASLYAMHRLLLTRRKPLEAWGIISGVVLLCSFAIYLGRYLRWNSWDIIFSPLGLLFDVSERLTSPARHEQTFGTTILFFGLIMVIYAAAWQLLAPPKRPRHARSSRVK